MVFAVNWPGQEPAVGRQAWLKASRSAIETVPAMTPPIAS